MAVVDEHRLNSPPEQTPDDEIGRMVLSALNEARRLEGRSPAQALHVLRQAMQRINVSPDFGSDAQSRLKNDGILRFTLPPLALALRAAEAHASALTGQWTQAPHAFIAMYEQLNPSLPESNVLLRISMNRLRMLAASMHRHWEAVLSFALDQIDALDGPAAAARLWGETDAVARDRYRNEALASVAVASSHLQLPHTAKSLYRKVMATQEDDSPERAAVLTQYGALLFKTGERDEAFRCYDRAVQISAALTEPTLLDVQQHIRALRFRADCFLRNDQHTSALEDTLTALRLCDKARDLSLYQSARSADSVVVDHITFLLQVLNHVPAAEVVPAAAVEVFLLSANSSAAAALRTRRRANPHTLRYLSDSTVASTVSAELSTWWRPVDEQDITDALHPQQPTLMIAATWAGDDSAGGFTLFLPGGGAAVFHPWQLDNEACEACGLKSCAPARLFHELLNPPPGSGSQDPSAWHLSPQDPALACLAARLLPREPLTAVLENAAPESTLKICPLGPLWRLPFAALPVGDQPLGTILPIVLGTPNAVAAPMSRKQAWLSHFDLALPLALTDLSNVVQEAARREVELTLVDTKQELQQQLGNNPSLIVLSCHGTGVGAGQTLHMAGGDTLNANDFEPVPAGSTFIIDCCWTGAVHDPQGMEALNLPLTLLAKGAHSVIGAIGPVNDHHASALLHRVLPQLQQPGVTPATALFRAWRSALEQDSDMPLNAWASFNTVAR
ncbi:CHAT domain-containing protein [Streptomyces sp. NPDC002133]|uniref:CHAT domain-containing tetratricopeptide repeat protein n=1 Tax=Streptomyces sp. NPDC002133 TaxID=3154409 RepID=UPI00331CF473